MSGPKYLLADTFWLQDPCEPSLYPKIGISAGKTTWKQYSNLSDILHYKPKSSESPTSIKILSTISKYNQTLARFVQAKYFPEVEEWNIGDFESQLSDNPEERLIQQRYWMLDIRKPMPALQAARLVASHKSPLVQGASSSSNKPPEGQEEYALLKAQENILRYDFKVWAREPENKSSIPENIQAAIESAPDLPTNLKNYVNSNPEWMRHITPKECLEFLAHIDVSRISLSAADELKGILKKGTRRPSVAYFRTLYETVSERGQQTLLKQHISGNSNQLDSLKSNPKNKILDHCQENSLAVRQHDYQKQELSALPVFKSAVLGEVFSPTHSPKQFPDPHTRVKVPAAQDPISELLRDSHQPKSKIQIEFPKMTEQKPNYKRQVSDQSSSQIRDLRNHQRSLSPEDFDRLETKMKQAPNPNALSHVVHVDVDNLHPLSTGQSKSQTNLNEPCPFTGPLEEAKTLSKPPIDTKPSYLAAVIHHEPEDFQKPQKLQPADTDKTSAQPLSIENRHLVNTNHFYPPVSTHSPTLSDVESSEYTPSAICTDLAESIILEPVEPAQPTHPAPQVLSVPYPDPHTTTLLAAESRTPIPTGHTHPVFPPPSYPTRPPPTPVQPLPVLGHPARHAPMHPSPHQLSPAHHQQHQHQHHQQQHHQQQQQQPHGHHPHHQQQQQRLSDVDRSTNTSANLSVQLHDASVSIEQSGAFFGGKHLHTDDTVVFDNRHYQQTRFFAEQHRKAESEHLYRLYLQEKREREAALKEDRPYVPADNNKGQPVAPGVQTKAIIEKHGISLEPPKPAVQVSVQPMSQPYGYVQPVVTQQQPVIPRPQPVVPQAHYRIPYTPVPEQIPQTRVDSNPFLDQTITPVAPAPVSTNPFESTITTGVVPGGHAQAPYYFAAPPTQTGALRTPAQSTPVMKPAPPSNANPFED